MSVLPHPLLEGVIKLAHAAGDAILPFWRAGVEVSAKADDSPVTAADLAAHHHGAGPGVDEDLGGGGAGISSGGGGGSSWTTRFEQPASTRAASNRQSIRRIDHPIERRHGRPRPPGRPAR